MLVRCPECGHQVSDQAKTCPSCGIDIAGKIIRCPDCGEVIFKEWSECPNCHCVINAGAVGVMPIPTARRADDTVDDEGGQNGLVPVDMPEEPAQKPKRKGRAALTALIVAFVIALIVVFLGFYFYKNQEQQNELRAYENALQSDHPTVLQSFLDLYQDAPREHRDSIEAHLATLKKIDTDWTNACVMGTKADFEKYMKLHPQSIHNTEALLLIDSLDWISAQREDTPEAYMAYMDAHHDGSYYDEAHAAYEVLDARKVKAEDRQFVGQLFTSFFQALADQDEMVLTSTVAPVLDSFLHRPAATKSDVLQYMRHIHEEDITQMTFTPNDDWKIDKQEAGDGQFTYSVDFTIDQKMERSDESLERFCTYKVQGKVSTEGKICELNMRKIVQ